MKIAFLFWSLEQGGVEHMMAKLSAEFHRRGHDVTVVLIRGERPNEYTLASGVHSVRLNTDSTASAFFRLTQHLGAAKYDVLYTAMPTTNVLALIAAKVAGVKTKVVISERSNPQLEAAHSKTWRYRASFMLQPMVYRLADAIVAVSAGLADDLARYAGLPRSSIQVIYNPAYSEPPANAQYLTHPWLTEGTDPVIISAGRLVIQKDYATLIRGFAALRRRRPAKLIILGDGPEKEALSQLIGQLGIAADAQLVGYVPEVHEYIRQADVFALTSIWEGFGNVLVQALGAGATIVSTDCPNGPQEILADGRFGQLVGVGDVDALATALETAIDHPADANEQMRRAGEFTVERSADAYYALFQRLAG